MTDTAATYSSPIDFRIGRVPPINTPTEVRPLAEEIYAGINQIIYALVTNCGIGPQIPSQWATIQGNPFTLQSGNLNRLYCAATEAIAYGAAVSFVNAAGVINVRNANATNNTRPCQGFCSTVGGIALGAVGEVILHSGVARLTGLTPGQNYYLSGTNGLLTTAPLVAAGNIEQYVGIGVDATHLSFNLGYWIQH